MNSITIGIFAAILTLTLAITVWAARRTRTATDFYAAGKGLTVVALPLGILGAVLGTLIAGRNNAHERRFDEVIFRIHTGCGRPKTSTAAIREGASP